MLLWATPSKGSYLYVNNQGEDEDSAKTALRWIDKNSGKVLKEGDASWKVSADDMSKTLIFQVTPVTKKASAANQARRPFPVARR